MPRRDGGESRKKCVDGIWLNPKYWSNGQSAAKLYTGECSTAIPGGEVARKRLAGEVVGICVADEDIACAQLKD